MKMASGSPCPHCGGHQVGRAHGLHGLGETCAFILLFLAGIVPGIVYYIWRESIPFCQTCGRRVARV